jgi:hypothetical protein
MKIKGTPHTNVGQTPASSTKAGPSRSSNAHGLTSLKKRGSVASGVDIGSADGSGNASIKSSTSPRKSLSISSSSSDAPTASAIDHYSGSVDLSALQQAATRMAAALPQCPDTAGASARKAHQKLNNELTQIANLAAAAALSGQAVLSQSDTDGIAPTAGGGAIMQALPLKEQIALEKAVRHHFAQAASLAKAVASKVAQPDREPFALLHTAFEELKRIHLTQGAPNEKELHAQAETANYEAAAQGMATGKPGALVITSAGLAGSAGVGLGSIGGGGSKGKLMLIDDDLGALYFDTAAGNVNGKAGLIDIVTGGGRGGATVSTGFYVGASVGDVVKNKLTDTANAYGGGSAGPKARAVREGWQVLKAVGKVVLGRSHVPAIGAPTHLSDAKLAKGATTTRLHVAAACIDEALGGGSSAKGKAAGDTWQDLVEKFYPSLPHLAQQALHDGEKLPMATAVDRATPAPLALSDRRFALHQPFGQAEFAVGANISDGEIPAAAGAGLTAKLDQLNVHGRSPKAAHELLDPGLMKDLAQTFKLVDQYDAVLTKNPDSARLQIYAEVKQALVDDQTAGPAADSPAADPFFGNKVPAQFSGAVNAPSALKITSAQKQCESIADMTALLAIAGEKLMAAPEASDPPSMRAALNTVRGEAFKSLDTAVWKAQYDATSGALVAGGYPGGLEAAMNDTKKFIAESHDALSIGLGLAGLHLAVNQRQLAPQTFDAANSSYLAARKLMDRTFLPIRKDNLVREHSSVGSTLVFNRYHGTGRIDVSVGGTPDLLGRASEALPQMQAITQNIALPSNLLKLGAVAQIQTRLADRQVLDARVGFDAEITLTLESGTPLTGELLNKVVCKGLEKAGLTGEEAKLQAKEIKQIAAELHGAIGPATGGVTVNVMYRVPPNSDGKSMELEYVRLMKSRTGGIAAAATALGTGNSVAASVFELTRGVEVEVLGPGIGYLSMHHGKLTGSIDAARKTLAADTGTDVKGKGTAKGAADVPFSEAAAAAFQADPDLRTRYFGKGDMIMQVLEKYLVCIDAIRSGKLPQPGEKFPNEFFRYFTDDMFMRARSVANEAAHFAPGNTADKATSPAPLSKLQGGLRLQDADGREHWDTKSTEWKALKARVAQLKDPAERAQFFTQDKDGANLLKSFVSVISNVQETWLATLNHAEGDTRPAGFGGHVKAEQLTPKTSKLPPSKLQDMDLTLPEVNVALDDLKKFYDDSAS